MAIGDDYQLNGQVRVSDAEAREHEPLIFAKRVTDVPSNQQVKVDANGRSDNQPVYVGFAPRGLPTSSNRWLLWEITYDVYGDFSYKKIAYDSYDNRVSATYS